MASFSPHQLAFDILSGAIDLRIREREALRGEDTARFHNSLTREIEQLRFSQRAFKDGTFNAPARVPEWFSRFAEQLTNVERAVTKADTTAAEPPGPVTITVTQQFDLTGFVRRTDAGRLVTDMASGVTVPVQSLHIADISRRNGSTVQGVVFNYQKQRPTHAIRLLTESTSYYRSTTTIAHGTLQEIPLPE